MKLYRSVPERRWLYPCSSRCRAAPMVFNSVSDVLFPLPTGHVLRGAGPPCAGGPDPQAAAATGAAPAPILLDKQATERNSAPCNLYPIQLSSVPFLTEGGSVGKKSSLRGRLEGSIETFPLKAKFGCTSVFGFGLCLQRCPPVSWLESSHVSRVSSVVKPAGVSRVPGGSAAPAWEHIFPFHR